MGYLSQFFQIVFNNQEGEATKEEDYTANF